MAEHLDNFIDIACDVKSNWPSNDSTGTTSLEMLESLTMNPVLMQEVATRTNIPVSYINLTVYSVLYSTDRIGQLFTYFNSTEKQEGRIEAHNFTNFTDNRCISSFRPENMISVFLAPALFIMILLSFATTRVWKKARCGGRPGLAIPVNLLDSYENRYTYAFAFGATSSRIVLIILDGDYTNVFGADSAAELQQIPSYMTAIIRIIAAVMIGISYYPFFACISTKHRLLGAVLGTIYACFWFFAYVSQAVECGLSPEIESMVVEHILLQIPPIVCHGFLVLCFLFLLIRTFISRKRRWFVTKYEWKENYKYQYVKKLVKRIPESEQTTIVVNGFKHKVVSNLYKWHPGFKYSTRMICIYITACICSYLVIVNFVKLGRGIHALLIALVDIFKEMTVPTSNDEEFWDRLRDGVDVALICWMVAIGLAALKDIVMMANMLTWYRGHALRLQRGDRGFLPGTINNKVPSAIMVASFKFAGYQVSYILWSFVITHIVLFLVTTVLAYFFIWPLMWGSVSDSIGFSVLLAVWPSLLISVLTILVQTLMAKYLFLRDFGETLALNNRRLFHIISYFFFFLNIFVGLFSCLIRIIYAVVVGVLFLPRLQKSSLPRDWELFDPGYNTYVGYLCLEHTHTNPILVTFSQFLIDGIDDGGDEDNNDDEEEQCVGLKKLVCSKRARNRWFLALTLTNNPELQHLRNHEKPNPVTLGLMGVAKTFVVPVKSHPAEVGAEVTDGAEVTFGAEGKTVEVTAM